MTFESKKILENHAVKLSQRVAEARLERAGVKLGKGLHLPEANLIGSPKGEFSKALIRKLAGD